MKISIIVPVYNVEKFLVRCLESVLNQTFQNIELIIINDKSTDSSDEIVKSYLTDGRIRYLVNEVNSGVSFSRNRGLDAVTGDYIMFLDGDDALEPNALSTLVTLLQKDDYDYILFNAKRVLEDDEVIEDKCIGYISDLSVETNNALGPQYLWNRVYKTSLFNEQRFVLGMIFEDQELLPKITFNTNKALYLNESLVHYRMRNGSLTLNTSHKTLDMYKALDMLYEYDYNRNGKLSYSYQIQIFINLNIRLTETRYIKGLSNRLEHLKKINYLYKKSCRGIKKNPYYKDYFVYFCSKKYTMLSKLVWLPVIKQLYVLIAPGKKK